MDKIRMLTINEVAERFPGLTRYRVRTMCIKGEIPCVMAGRKYLICEQVLADYLTQPVQPEAPGEDGAIRRIEQ